MFDVPFIKAVSAASSALWPVHILVACRDYEAQIKNHQHHLNVTCSPSSAEHLYPALDDGKRHRMYLK